ncbi:MAG: FAD-dependent oxidoreductase [Schleiferiaceae bacterium]
MKHIVLIGAGLAGSYMAYALGKKGYSVEVFEKRPDPRKAAYGSGRSINLVVSHRGWTAFKYAGIEEEIRKIVVPAHGRQIHDLEGNETFFPYSIDGQAIHSISRSELNETLLNLAEAQTNVRIHFDHICERIDTESGNVHLSHHGVSVHVTGDLIVGADGAGSAVRRTLMGKPRFNFSQNFIDSGYKEVHIPAGEDGAPQLNIDALHIWPRREFMLMGLANTDHGFTGTVFAPFTGEYGLDQLTTGKDGLRYFEKYFKDAIPLIPNLEEQWENNPTSALACIRCHPYHWGSNTMLIGDAAHATVPFYGEGMNGSLEDVRVFLELLDEHGDSDMKLVLNRYTELREPAGNALVDLSLRNFIEMRDLVADPAFQLRKKIERNVQKNHPDQWTPLYSLVKFTNIPYHEAMAQGERHDEIMADILALENIEARWDSKEVEEMILERL